MRTNLIMILIQTLFHNYHYLLIINKNKDYAALIYSQCLKIKEKVVQRSIISLLKIQVPLFFIQFEESNETRLGIFCNIICAI